MSLAEIAEAVWERETIAARLARAALRGPSWVFGRVVARRNAGYDAAVPARQTLAAISIGNLTVGGTGKTPLAAWCVAQLRSRGAHPSIVMRGVGDDEWRVHGILNPGIPVIVSPDRIAGMLVAKSKGADCSVLDDAFQHRRAARNADLVLLSADRWTGRTDLLPAGPYREPLQALRRASGVVITVKAADAERIGAVVSAARAAAPDVQSAVIRLVPGAVRLAASIGASGGAGSPRRALLDHPPGWLAGRDLVAASAIGDPAAFEAQLRALGASLRRVHRYPDHHKFATADAVHIASSARDSAGVICTLKDAVKLIPVWPREAPPLWYLSQSVVVERGAEVLDRALARVMTARTATTPTAGSPA